MKYLFLILPLFFLGCNNQIETLSYKNFIKQHGTNKIFQCESGFLVEIIHWSNLDSPTKYLVKNDANIPTRCENSSNVQIQVKETVATGTLSGSIN